MTLENLKLFIQELNLYHSHIKFTENYDVTKKSVPFLDMQVSIDSEGYIKTDLFTKETAKCTYLLPSSCHPAHITKNIPYSLGYRLLRICSDKNDFVKRLGELKTDLMSRNYHCKIIPILFGI